MSVHAKLQQARVKLQNIKLSKSGHNKFAGYEYFELGDFLPQIQTIFAELGLCGTIKFEAQAELRICDTEKPEDAIVFSCPIAQASLKGCHEVQNLGASMTYIRRYLWVNALEIVEHDALDATTGKDNKTGVIHKPTDNPDFKPDAEEETFLLSVVDEVIALKDNPAEAAEKLIAHNLDADEKAYVWNKLGPYSALRAAIKKHSQKKEG